MSQNYKDTLNLPRTDFPMKASLAAREPEMLRVGREAPLPGIQNRARSKFVLHDGPPFAKVTSTWALTKIPGDFVVKSQTMSQRAPYVPGWDCHGLPIGKVVKESRELSALRSAKMRSVCAKVHQYPARAFSDSASWRLGTSVSDDGSLNTKWRFCAFAVFVEEGLVRGAEACLLEHRRADRPREAEVVYQDSHDNAVLRQVSTVGRASSRTRWQTRASPFDHDS
jgi:hypothetical protein